MVRITDSPRSSEGVSLKGISPETNITAYTPDDSRNGVANTSGTPSKGDATVNKPFTYASSSRPTPVKPAHVAVHRSLTPGTAESSFTIKGFNCLFDPFVEGQNIRGTTDAESSGVKDANDLKKLSATAQDFHPNQSLIRDSVPDIVSSTPLPIRSLLEGSTPLPRVVPLDMPPKAPLRGNKTSLHDGHSPTGELQPSYLHHGLPFSTDGPVRRYVCIGNISFASLHLLQVEFTLHGIYTDIANQFTKIGPTCELFLVFDDLRAAEQSHDKVVALNHGVTIQYLNPVEFTARSLRTLDESSRNIFAGQIHLTAAFQGFRNQEWDDDYVFHACRWLAAEYGEVRSVAEFDGGVHKSYRVEFFKLSVAKRFHEAYGQGRMHKGYWLSTKAYMPSCAQKPVPEPTPMAEPMSRVDSGFADMLAKFDINSIGGGPSMPVTTTPQPFVPTPPQSHAPYGWFYSPTGRTKIPRATPVVPVGTAAFGYPPNGALVSMNGQLPLTPRVGNFPGIIGEPPQVFPNSGSWVSSASRDGSTGRLGPRGLRQDHANGHHNTVNIDKIANGTDVRTTVMLRNIPNKMHLPDLKKFIDRSSYGKYDFIYLRIDFQNDCNVGYAFINFENSESIINFMLDINNKRWDEFRSWKVAEVSYATIQGKDCLIQKFRNSSVMKEFDGYRPKLYFTESDPQRCGQEAPFPEPDNWSKVKRSVDNAQHIGLFPPRAGQQTRDEQRRRRSQFDRGTPRAQLEESYDRRSNIHHIQPNDHSLVRFGYQQPTITGHALYQY